MFSELFAPVSIGVRTIAKTVRILERNQSKDQENTDVKVTDHSSGIKHLKLRIKLWFVT